MNPLSRVRWRVAFRRGTASSGLVARRDGLLRSADDHERLNLGKDAGTNPLDPSELRDTVKRLCFAALDDACSQGRTDLWQFLQFGERGTVDVDLRITRPHFRDPDRSHRLPSILVRKGCHLRYR